MAENEKDEEKEKVIDEDLEALLNSALQDFDKFEGIDVASAASASLQSSKSRAKDDDHPLPSSLSPPSSSTTSGAMPMPDMLNPEVMAQQFEQIFQSLINQQQPAVTTAGERDVDSVLSQTAQSLEQNAENLEMPFSDEQLMEAMGQLGLGGGEAGGDDFFSNMSNLVQGLLSKDVLYPSIKEICDKYPDWLDSHRSSLPEEDVKRYEKQLELMTSVCDEFDDEKDDDDDDVKKTRFEKIITTMQEIQMLGPPPSDLVGDMPEMVEFDENGMPKLPPGMSPDACSIM